MNGIDLRAGMFWLSIRRRMVKRDPPRQRQPSAAAVPAVKEGRDKDDISGTVEISRLIVAPSLYDELSCPFLDLQ